MHLISLCKLFEGTRILKPEVRSSFVKNVTRILHFRVFLTFLTNLAINRVFGSQLECIAGKRLPSLAHQLIKWIVSKEGSVADPGNLVRGRFIFFPFSVATCGDSYESCLEKATVMHV